MHDWKMELYWRLPVPLQEAALSWYAGYLDRMYYGDGYESWRRQYRQWQRWSRDEAEAWQARQLQAMVHVAASRVPYYRSGWRDLDWRSIRSATDLPRLPLLDKHSIRQNEQQFLADGIERKSLWAQKTSGTTGTSLTIYWPKRMLRQWWALTEVMVRNIAGVGQDLPRAMIGGRPVVKGNTAAPPFWRFNQRWKQLYLSSYHVSRETAPAYVAALRRYGSQWITGYGSAIAALARSAMDAALPPLAMRAVIASGDTLLPEMRADIERFFQCKCFDHYGQSEGVAMAMECPSGRMHVLPAVGIIEIVRPDGSPCRRGEAGEIAATGLLNDAMPLIRYRVGDYGAYAEEDACSCGNPQPVITHLEGRVDDYLVTRDGRKIGRLSTAIKRSPSIHSAQLVQEREGEAYLLVRPGAGYRPKHAAAVYDDIVERIGELDLKIIEVPEIPKTPQGKTSLVVRLADRPHMRSLYDPILHQ